MPNPIVNRRILLGGVAAGPAYDTDAAAFFAKGVTLGEAPLSGSIKGYINTAVLDLKAASLWTPHKALYPFVGATAGWHSLNLKDPTQYQITWSGGLTHDANGVTGNGSSGFGDTGLNALSVLSATSNALFAYTRLAIDEGAPSVSTYDGELLQIVSNDGGSAKFADSFVGNNVTGAVANGQGLFTVSRTSNNAVAGYRNATSVGTNTGAATMPNSNLKLLRFDTLSVFSAQNLAAAGIATGLTSGNVTTLQGIIQALETALGRQV